MTIHAKGSFFTTPGSENSTVDGVLDNAAEKIDVLSPVGYLLRCQV